MDDPAVQKFNDEILFIKDIYSHNTHGGRRKERWWLYEDTIFSDTTKVFCTGEVAWLSLPRPNRRAVRASSKHADTGVQHRRLHDLSKYEEGLIC